MDKIQNTLIESLYKIRKGGIDLKYPISNQRLENIITDLLTNYSFICKTQPRLRSKEFNKHGILENTSTIVEMMLVHLDNEGRESSPTKITLFFDSYLNENNEPEHAISGMFKNKFKEAIYRPSQVVDEANVVEYVKNILNELSHRL